MAETKLASLLIVDDEIDLMNTLCEMLGDQGYETIGFTKPHEALAQLKERSFDLLLSDLMMPEMDGIALLKAAIEIDPHIVCIIMTGHGTVQSAVESMKVGAFDYLMKPFKLTAMLPVVSRAIQMRRLRIENLQLRETLGIHELSQAIAFTLDTNTILSKIADAALQQCQADEVSILLPTDDRSELYVAVIYGQGREHLLGERMPIDRGVAGWVARNRKPVTLQGKASDPRFDAINPREGIYASISMPMIIGNELAGVLNVNLTRPRRPFTLGQVKALSILANLAASALENARLYEQALAAENKYRGIFENAIEGIFVSGPSGRFLSANPSLTRMLGYESADELTSSITDLRSQLYVDPMRRDELLRLTNEQDVVSGFECEAYRKDGSKIWVKINVRSINDLDGECTGYEGTMEDITERKQLQAELLQSQKMEAIGTLAGGVAHDFNNLLTAILGFSQLIIRRVNDKTDPVYQEASEIVRAAERGASLTNQLLAFSRKQAIQPSILDLNDIVNEIQNMLKRLIGEDIDLITRLSHEPCWVRADQSQIQQIILNLAINARDAMPRGGTLEIETIGVSNDAGVDLPGDQLHKECVCLAVSDNGCGMEGATLSRIFEPFFTTKEKGRGTGLGLSTVYGVVNMCNGDIDVSSEPNRGTTFKVYLPRVDCDSCKVEEEAVLVVDTFGSETVLLVEDEEMIGNLVQRVLEAQGYNVLSAFSPGDALQICQQYDAPIHLILTDLIMPNMNGDELSNQVRLLLPSIKVLYMSGYTKNRSLEECSDVPFLQKPFTMDSLIRKVRDVLR